MSKQKPMGVFGKLICVVARSGIIAALYLAAFLAAVQLATVLPQPWSVVGIAALLLVIGRRLSGKWPGRESRLESIALGYQPDRQAILQPAAPVPPGRNSSAVLASLRTLADQTRMPTDSTPEHVISLSKPSQISLLRDTFELEEWLIAP